MRTFLALLLLAAAFQPTASAQGLVQPTLIVYLDDPGPSLVAGTNGTILGHVTYSYGPGAQPTPNPDVINRPENTTPTSVALSILQVPSWALSARIEPEVVVFPVDQRAIDGDRQETIVTVILEIAPDAPAFVKEELAIAAEASPNGNIGGASAQSDPIAIKVQPFGKLNVTAEPQVFVPGGRWTVVPYTVLNQGNSDIVAKLNVTLKPENAQVEFPTTLELKAKESKVVEVRIRTPWSAAETGDLELEAVPLVEGEEGTAATMSVEVQGRSAVPGIEAPLLLLLVGLLAWRRR